MKPLRVPSLQHMARNAALVTPPIVRALVALVLRSPTFSYSPIMSAVRDMLIFKQPYEQIEAGFRRSVKRPLLLENYLSLLPLVRDYFSSIQPDYVNEVRRYTYGIGRGLSVPFDPPILYGIGGQKFLPWFVFWQNNPISDLQYRLFVTIVREIMSQDADLEDARFLLLDFSRPKGSSERVLRVSDASDVEPLDENTKRAFLDAFAEAFSLAQNEIAVRAAAAAAAASDAEGSDARPSDNDGEQPDLFRRR